LIREAERLVEAGPDPEKDGFARWRCIDLKRFSAQPSVKQYEGWY
jgi:hypothetical protein